MKYSILVFFALLSAHTTLAQNAGDTFFGTGQVHEIYMTFPQPGYWDSLTANYTADAYMQGDIVIDGTSYPQVGIKFKGNSSYNNPSDKKPFKIDFNEYTAGQDLDGLKKLNLNNNFKDPSLLREKLTLDFYRDHGIIAPRCGFAKLYINGTYWGLYNAVEEVDVKQFLNAQFNNNDGNLFKGDPHGDLRWLGPAASAYYTEYELHTNETVNDWTDLIAFINTINNSGTNFHDSLEANFNTTAFIKQWAALNVFSNMDSYIGSGHNYYIYHDTITGKWEWIAWDVNESFGSFRQNLTAAQVQMLSMFYVNNPNNKPLAQKMLADPAYKSALVNTICQWLQYDFSNAAMDSKIDTLANLIRPAVYADTKKGVSNQDFETNLASSVTMPGPGGEILGLKSFIANRRNALITELAANGCNLSVRGQAGAVYAIHVFPNPAKDFITVKAEPGASLEVRVCNMLGQEVQQPQKGTGSLRIDISHLQQGAYFLSVNGESHTKLLITE